MRKRLIAIILAVGVSVGLLGCGDDTAHKDMFCTIDVDNSKTLPIYKHRCEHYAYLTDTGAVYVVSDSSKFMNGFAPVISPSGNYYRYDVDTQSVIEITNDSKEEMVAE